MKKIIKIIGLIVSAAMFSACTPNDIAQMNYAREEQAAKYQSDYARIVNKLEMKEGNFENLRRVVFYNVRLGQTVFSCEGFCHVNIDKDGDVELVVKVGPNEYLRHYLGQKQDITYFSEQINATRINDYRYQIVFNPDLWIPEIKSDFE